MPDLSLDFETRSTVKLRKAGLYVYAQHPDTEIMCMAWAIGPQAPRLWLPGQPLPEAFVDHVANGGPLRAWNSAFERLVWYHKLPWEIALFPVLDQWTCTAAEAAAMALPRGLGNCAKALGMADQKDAEGHRLMMKYSRPRKVEEDGTIIWWDDPEDLQKLYSYCKQDVVVERSIVPRVRRLVPRERELWLLDQRVNDRGIRIDTELVAAGLAAVSRETARANARIEVITAGDAVSVTKRDALMKWLCERIDMDNLQKQTVKDTLAGELPDDVREVLMLRADAGRTSLAKYAKALECMCHDGMARGLTLYHGASTGRWSGRLLQPHNFPRPEIDPAPFHQRFLNCDWAGIEAEASLMQVAVSTLRGMFIPSCGDFYSADFAQIEARVLGWLAGHKYGGHEYEKMGAAIYGLDWKTIGKDDAARQIGKNATLGCGFGMGWERFQAQVYEQTGLVIEDDLAQHAIKTYRAMKPKVVEYWKETERAAKRAVMFPGKIVRSGGVRWVLQCKFLRCVLPSGRALAYAIPTIENQQTPWGTTRAALKFMGIDSRFGNRKWHRIQTYGGHLVENVVQAIARDMLAEAMLRVEAADYRVVLTVHDEILAEKEDGDLDEFLMLMKQRPAWAPTCPIEAEGWRGDRWHK